MPPLGFLKGLFGNKQVPSPVCPYCGVLLSPPPRRSRKCPDCHGLIVVRTNRSTKEKLFLTEEEAKAFDTDRRKEAKRNKALRYAMNIGCSEADFRRMEGDLSKRFGVALPGDVFWALANETIREPMLKNDWHAVSNIYWAQARWLYEEGREHVQLHRECSKADLQYHASRGVLNVRIMTNGAASCSECRKNEGREICISEALETLPIPNERCEHGWCQCGWRPVTESVSGVDPSEGLAEEIAEAIKESHEPPAQ